MSGGLVPHGSGGVGGLPASTSQAAGAGRYRIVISIALDFTAGWSVHQRFSVPAALTVDPRDG